MLRRLSIRNVVLIDRLDIELHAGLTAFTGETGAGKSILLDSLGLALGQRSDGKMVRQGEDQASVTAVFDITQDHPTLNLLSEQGIVIGDEIILRRQISADGRSRAFINDESVSIGFLKKIGALLVEIEGQFESHGLLDVSTHLFHLDDYAGQVAARLEVGKAYALWQLRKNEYEQTQRALKEAEKDEEYLRHHLIELEAAHPEEGEEEKLVQERTLMMQQGQIFEAVNVALAELGGENGADRAIAKAQRKMERWQSEEIFQPVLASLEKAYIELSEAMEGLEHLRRDLSSPSYQLEKIEDRLYALRDLARKHRVTVGELPQILEEMREKVSRIQNGSADLAHLEKKLQEAWGQYDRAATKLSDARLSAAKKLDQKINKELPALKLEKARFVTKVELLSEEDWGPNGKDRVQFEATTNPGQPAGPIHRIASGGELARFMLALKVTLAGSDNIPCLVFDEVDTGIGGATAAAVGERLKLLGRRRQVLVVTHSPQVAALAEHHLRVQKSGKSALKTEIENLNSKDRQEEIARMLSGAVISAEARAAAKQLLAGSKA